jgi:integrase
MDKAATPVIANRLLSLISILMKHAIKEGWRDDNPAFGVERQTYQTDGFATWSEPDIAVYRAYYPLGTRERLVLELALGTAQRRGDLVRLGWRHVVNGAIVIKQSKTGATTAPIPIVSELRAALDLCSHDRLTFIAGVGGRTLGAESVGAEFRGWLNKACLPRQLALHGLRKAAARRLACAKSSAIAGRPTRHCSPKVAWEK